MSTTVVPALGDHRRERPPAVCGHLINVPTHFNVKLPPISGHLPNADADSHLLVVSTCYNGQCKQMPRFRWSFQPKIAIVQRSVFKPAMSKKGKIFSSSLDQRIEMLRRVDEAHPVEQGACWWAKRKLHVSNDSKQTRLPSWASGIRATELILNTVREAPKDEFR